MFPTIRFSEQTKLLVTKIVRKEPSNIRAFFSEPNSNEVALKFGLLNPSDFVEFNFYIAGNYQGTPYIDSRIKGIKEIRLSDKTQEKYKSATNFGTSVYIVGFFTLMFFIIAIYGFTERRKHQHARKLIKENPNIFNEMNSVGEFDTFIRSKLQVLSTDEVTELYSIIIQPLKRFNLKKKEFSELATEYINSIGGGEAIIIISIFTVPIGVIFIVSQFI